MKRRLEFPESVDGLESVPSAESVVWGSNPFAVYFPADSNSNSPTSEVSNSPFLSGDALVNFISVGVQDDNLGESAVSSPIILRKVIYTIITRC